MDYLEYKGYKGSVEYSNEDNCLFGKVQGMSKDLIAYEGQTLEELRKEVLKDVAKPKPRRGYIPNSRLY